jgi:hypothetical protein
LATDGGSGSDGRRNEAFRVLGLPVGSDREAVVRAYRRLARATHPDVSADPKASDRFATLTAAYRLASEVPGRDAGPAPAMTGGRSPATGNAADDLRDDWATAGWDLSDAWPMRASPEVSMRSRHRPPIIAGPVRVSPPRSDADGEGA